MKKHYVYLFLLLVVSNSFLSQTTNPQKNHDCGADALHLQSLKNDLTYKRNFDQQNVDWQQYLPAQQAIKSKRTDKQAITPPPINSSSNFDRCFS